jgi:hypothetical protein
MEAMTMGTMNDEARARIWALQREARKAGDEAQVELCQRALAGDDEALTECLSVIAEAAAQAGVR